MAKWCILGCTIHLKYQTYFIYYFFWKGHKLIHYRNEVLCISNTYCIYKRTRVVCVGACVCVCALCVCVCVCVCVCEHKLSLITRITYALSTSHSCNPQQHSWDIIMAVVINFILLTISHIFCGTLLH